MLLRFSSPKSSFGLYSAAILWYGAVGVVPSILYTVFEVKKTVVLWLNASDLVNSIPINNFG